MPNIIKHSKTIIVALVCVTAFFFLRTFFFLLKKHSLPIKLRRVPKKRGNVKFLYTFYEDQKLRDDFFQCPVTMCHASRGRSIVGFLDVGFSNCLSIISIYENILLCMCNFCLFKHFVAIFATTFSSSFFFAQMSCQLCIVFSILYIKNLIHCFKLCLSVGLKFNVRYLQIEWVVFTVQPFHQIEVRKKWGGKRGKVKMLKRNAHFCMSYVQNVQRNWTSSLHSPLKSIL